MRAGRIQSTHHRVFSRWTRAAGWFVILLACLAQALAPAQHQHGSLFASHSIVADAGSGLAKASLNADRPGVLCAPAADAHERGVPEAPRHHANCPCCLPIHAAAGILPSETTQTLDAPRRSESVSPPTLLGALSRYAAFAGQPRAPPILL